MKNVSEQVISRATIAVPAHIIYTFTHALLGSIFLALMSQLTLRLPFTPIPITLQTFALFVLILAQGRKKSCYSVVLYLLQASMGFPVLNGGTINPAWMFYPTAGYLVGFIGCSLVAGYLLERIEKTSVLWTLFSIACGQVVLYSLGTAYLACFVGMDQAFALGVVPFVPGALIKLCAVSCLTKPIRFVTTLFKGQQISTPYFY